MSNAKEKAKEMLNKFTDIEMPPSCNYPTIGRVAAKEGALIAVGNEYHEKRELLFLMRSNGLIKDRKAYFFHIERLIEEENQVKAEIEKL